MRSGTNTSHITINGLSENIPQAMDIVEDLLANALPDEEILENLKSDMLKSRADSKLRQRSCFSALQRYVIYGPEFIKKTTLANDELSRITSEELLAKVRSLTDKQHEVLYYGPESESGLKKALSGHHAAGALEPLEKSRTATALTDKSEVYIAPYDAKQLYYIQYSNRGDKFDVSADPEIELYNGYFGGGMNAIVFQEMREARGLAYSAYADLSTPGFKDDTYYYMAFIATQNDKMKQAIEAFDDIINKLEEPREKQIFEKIQDMTLADVKAAQEKWVKGRHYIYGILGDEKDIDMTYLSSLGPVKRLTLEEIFGY